MTGVRASDSVFFPLASNAHALVSGAPVESVRARLKVASLLYDGVLIEAGRRLVVAGPDGSFTWRMGYPPDQAPSWQTAQARHAGQSGPFALAMGPEKEPGVASDGPLQEVLRSATSICWEATLQPFAAELPAACDWISFGVLAKPTDEVQRVAEQWKKRDNGNAALERLVPEGFVRSALVNHIADDLAVGACAGWDTSVDRFHGQVVNARFAGDASLRGRGFALPILIPRVDRLGWEDIIALRRLPTMARLRSELRDVEEEALEIDASGDIELAVRKAFDRKLRAAACDVGGVRCVAGHAVVNLVIGVAIGYATLGLAVMGPVAGGAAGMAITGGLEVREVVRRRADRAWIGAMGRIADAARA
jgi:hypothetical protein